MKIQTTVEITPQEAKELLGIPTDAFAQLLRAGHVAPQVGLDTKPWQEYQKLFDPLSWIGQKSDPND